MKPVVTVTSRDKGWKEFSKAAKALMRDTGAHLKVGVLDDGGAGSEQREGGLTNAELASVHEFGSSDGRVPERSFIRSTFAAHEPEYVKMLGTLLGQVLAGQMGFKRAFDLVGLRISTDIKKAVTTGDPVPPPNTPEVAARKRKGKAGVIRTLVDTGRMIASVTWAFVTKT